MENLIYYLNSIHPLSSALQEHLKAVLQHKRLEKKEMLLQQNQVCKYIYFVEEGLFRCYYLNVDGKEICSWFMKNGDVIISVESFFKQKPSYENIQALQVSSVYFLSHAALMNIYELYPEFNKIGRILTENYYCLSEQRSFLLRATKAKERYQMFVEAHSDLLGLISSSHLASFLGITLETLSRLRSMDRKSLSRTFKA